MWAYADAKYDAMDYAGMMSLQKLKADQDDQAVVVRAMMLNNLFGNLLRESLLMKPDIANAASSILWDEVIDDSTQKELKHFVESHPDAYRDPSIACNAFFAALNASSDAAPLVQLLSKLDMAALKQQMVDLLPSYITYFERLSYDLFDFYCALTASYETPDVAGSAEADTDKPITAADLFGGGDDEGTEPRRLIDLSQFTDDNLPF